MRDRQILEAVYQLGRATVADVHGSIPDPPTSNAVRTMLGSLVDRGVLKRTRQGRAAVYTPRKTGVSIARDALRRVLSAFFGGSLGRAVEIYLTDPKTRISAEELDRLRELIDQAERERKSGDRRAES